MDILEMTVGACMKEPRIKAALEKYIPDLSKYPVMLFKNKKVSALIDMAVAQKMFSREDAQKMLALIEAEIK